MSNSNHKSVFIGVVTIAIVLLIVNGLRLSRVFVVNISLIHLIGAKQDYRSVDTDTSIYQHPRVSWRLGQRQMELNNKQRSDLALTFWRSAPDWNANMLFSQAHEYSALENTELAIASIDLALQLNPKFASGAAFAGALLNRERQWQRSLRYWEIALNSQSLDPVILSGYGYSLYRVGDVERAESYLRKAAELDPISWNINFQYLFYLRERAYHNKDKSLHSYKSQLMAMAQTHPDAVVLDRLQGEFAIFLGNYAEAEAYYTNVVRERPEWNSAIIELGLLWLLMDQPDKAMEIFSQTLGWDDSTIQLEKVQLDMLKQAGILEKLNSRLCGAVNVDRDVLAQILKSLRFDSLKCGKSTM